MDKVFNLQALSDILNLPKEEVLEIISEIMDTKEEEGHSRSEYMGKCNTCYCQCHFGK